MIFQNIFEPVRKVDAPAELRPETELPPLEMPEPNFFDGMGDTWKAIPNAVLDTASSAITGLRQIPLENFTTQPEVREWVRRQREEVMPENARRIREIAKQEYELDPQTSGTAAQIVYGLGEMIPKAVLYGSVAGPAGGALLFGADVGVNRTQTLLDEGVDEQTAINAGMLTFAANAIGLKLPAAFETGRRLTSAAIGAGANVGLNVAEVQGIHWILENQNYDELAKNYELNFADNAVAAGLGAAFGAAFWRPTTRVRFEQERKALSERFATELERTGKFTPQQVTAQANLNSSVVTSAASRWGLTPERVSSVAPRVRVDENIGNDGFSALGTAQERLAQESKQWGDFVDGLTAKPTQNVVMLRQTPLVMHLVGADFLELRTAPHMFDGIFPTAKRSNPKHHVHTEMTREILKQLPAALTDPIAVFKSATDDASKVFMLEVRDTKGETVILPVSFNASGRHAEINLITSAYGKESKKWFADQENNNRLLYANQEKIQRWNESSGSNRLRGSNADGTRIYTEKDLVNLQAQYPAYYQSAWHGSPYLFNRFTLDHIGSGVGAQWRGWGLYFTLDRGVAERYRHTTTTTRLSREDAQRYNQLIAYRDSLRGDLQQAMDPQSQTEIQRRIDEVDVVIRALAPDAGYVYQVEIPDDDVMVRSSAKVSDQPEIVQVAFQNLLPGEDLNNLTGLVAYRRLAKKLGSPRAASEALNGEGVQGLRYRNSTDGECAVVWNDEAISIHDFLQRSKDNGAALGSYSPTENRITLTPNANISTFSHEIGHWYLHNLMLASQFEEAAGNVKQDVDVLLKAFGINSVDDWNALGVNGQRKYHERFASWVEQYLSEGKSPSPSLASFFKRFGEWLKDVYEHFSDAVGGRYQAEFGEELPPLSAEVRKVLDRMYTDEFGSKTVRPDKTQVAAARAVQVEETNREKRNRILATDSEDDYSKAVAAQRKAASDLNSGTPIDVSQQMRGASLNEQVLGAEQKKFAREVMSGDGRTAVVLQNRDRSNVVSVGQMNSIASDPQYGLLSFSRNTASGAPIVSYGTLPDDAYLGVRDYVIDSGEQVPVQYAVVEADTVQTSNRFDGSQNPDYGDASLMNVVAGNGRLTGITEAYRRGTAQQYRDALMADNQHGVDPAVIASMQHPVLVRYMPQEKVSSGFVSRSNSDQVMARSNVEIAAEDAPRIRENASLYRFDEEGMPTADTVRQFLIDIGEPNALGRLINSNGNPTPEAIRRIQTAVFHEAYQNDVLTELFSSTTDANIKRILTAMAAFAPRIIEMRNAGIDLARGIVEAANAVRMAREEGHSLQDLLGQLSFLDDPTTTPFIELLARNANSAAAIGRVLDPLADWTVNAMRAADGGLFGDENVVRTDVADVLGQMRRIENEQRVAAGQEPLPELDVAAIRASIQNLQTQLDEIAAQAPAQVDVPAQAEPNPQQVQATVREGVANDPDAIRMQELASQQPEQTFLFEDEDGQTVELRFDEVESEMQRIETEGKQEASGIAQAAICIMRNDGAQ